MPDPSTQVRAASARMVKVKNTGNDDYVEEFKGKRLTVPRGGHIVMSVLDANRFIGQFKKPLKKINGQWVAVDGDRKSVV